MNIRLATIEDANAVAQIHVATWQAAYRDLVSAEYLNTLSIEQREAMWLESIRRGAPELWVADAGSSVIGWVAFGPCRDDGATPQTGEIWAIYVTANHWSSGVGRSLWLKARQRLVDSGYTSASLWVLVKNHRAIRFYIAAGFVPDVASTKEITIAGGSLQEMRYVAEICS